MAKPFVITAKSDEDLRKEIARQALCDMHYCMDALGQLRQGVGGNEDSSNLFDAVWPTLAHRIDALNCAALDALTTESDTEALLDIVYGEEGWLIGENTAEVSHG